MYAKFDVLIAAGVIAVLAVKAPFVVVGGMLYVWWLSSRVGRELTAAQAATSAMIGGFGGHALLTVGPLLPMLFISPLLDFLSQVLHGGSDNSALVMAGNLFGWGL